MRQTHPFQIFISYLLLFCTAAVLIYGAGSCRGNVPETADSFFGDPSFTDAARPVHTDNSSKIDRPAGVILVEMIVRTGQEHSRGMMLRILLCQAIGLLLLLRCAIPCESRHLLPENCIHSRKITLQYIHHKDGRKG